MFRCEREERGFLHEEGRESPSERDFFAEKKKLVKWGGERNSIE